MSSPDHDESVPQPDEIPGMLSVIAADAIYQMTLPELRRFLHVCAYHVEERLGPNFERMAHDHARIEEIITEVGEHPFGWASEIRRHAACKSVVTLAFHASELLWVGRDLKWEGLEALEQLRDVLMNAANDLVALGVGIRLSATYRELRDRN